MAALNPYLGFGGNCEEAFNFYKTVFGGEFQTIMRYKEVPADMPMPPTEGEKLVHISLPIGKGTILMGSDKPSSMGPVTTGDNFTISITTESNEETTSLFKGLSAGGKVTMPLAKTFYSENFGMLVDKFGVQWMVNFDLNQPT
ncbi:MAG: glyoxalase [Bacteroidota bacterium]|nr:glyoxalase [Bacteroidota bacterium]